MLHIYTGDGKGKTIAALGMALRMVGAGKKALLAQFLKDGQSSEIKAIRKIKNFDIKSFGRKGFFTKKTLTKKDFDLAKQGFNFVQKQIANKKYDLIILDEINAVINLELIKANDLSKLIKKAPRKTEIVLTGRNAPKEILKIADLITEMKEKKHYFKRGIKARRGIEY